MDWRVAIGTGTVGVMLVSVGGFAVWGSGGIRLASRTHNASYVPSFEGPTEGGVHSCFASGERPEYRPVRLSNGKTVELRFVQSGDTGKAAWSPNGTARLEPDSLPFDNQPDHGSREIVLAVDVPMSLRDYTCVVQTPHRSPWNVWVTYGDGKGHSFQAAAFRAPIATKTSDVRLGIAFGSYGTVARAKIGADPLRAVVGPFDISRIHTMFGTPCRLSCMASVRVAPDLNGYDLRLVAIDKLGQEHPSTAYQPEAVRDLGDDRLRRILMFPDLDPSTVSAVEPRKRDFEWVQFDGIRLRPLSAGS